MVMNELYEEFLESLESKSDTELLKAFNNEVGNKGWTSARGSFLAALRTSFEKRNIDISAIGDETSFSLKDKIILDGRKVLIAE
ncbi:MAG: hypothetical protein ACI85O_001286 [Saprospiraceae bacterium]|jgi:hypothetical protein